MCERVSSTVLRFVQKTDQGLGVRVVNSQTVRRLGLPSVVVGGRRRAFSLIEIIIVISITAIISAVALPRWQSSVERTKVAGMRRTVAADVDQLRRRCVRRGQTISVTIQPDSACLLLSPAQPGFMGDAAGVVNYANRFPNVRFSAVNIDGGATCDINIYGDMVVTATSTAVTDAVITLSGGSTLQVCDLLASQGLKSASVLEP